MPAVETASWRVLARVQRRVALLHATGQGKRLRFKDASLRHHRFQHVANISELPSESFELSRHENCLRCLLVGLLHKLWAIAVYSFELVKKSGSGSQGVSSRESYNFLHCAHTCQTWTFRTIFFQGGLLAWGTSIRSIKKSFVLGQSLTVKAGRKRRLAESVLTK